jgi:hypothetical protein
MRSQPRQGPKRMDKAGEYLSPDCHIRWVQAAPTATQALAWKRLWKLLLQGDPAVPVQDEPPLDVADERGGRKRGDGQA